MSSFDKALEYTLGNEGYAFTNNPNDPAGATKMGITIATLRRWRQAQNPPQTTTEQDVQNLTLDDAKQIYQAYYWSEMGLDQVNDDSVATAIFDLGVNAGPNTSIQWAQRAVGANPDGKLGPQTAQAVNACPRVQFFQKFITFAQQHYIMDVVNNPGQLEFLSGWLARSQRLIGLIGG